MVHQTNATLGSAFGFRPHDAGANWV